MSAGGTSSQSSGTSLAEGRSFIDPTQLQALTSLWGQASGQANPRAVQSTSQWGIDKTNPLVNAGMNTTRSLMSGNVAGLADARGRFGAADTTLAGLSNPTAMIKAEEGSLRSGLDRLFRNTVMPSVREGAIGGGGFGGGRQGVAEGVAAGELGAAYREGLGDITARARDQALQATTARQTGAGLLGQLGLGTGQLQGAAAEQSGQQALTLQQLLMGNATAGMTPLMMLGQILGGPTVVNNNRAVSTDSSRSGGFNFGWS